MANPRPASRIIDHGGQLGTHSCDRRGHGDRRRHHFVVVGQLDRHAIARPGISRLRDPDERLHIRPTRYDVASRQPRHVGVRQRNPSASWPSTRIHDGPGTHHGRNTLWLQIPRRLRRGLLRGACRWDQSFRCRVDGDAGRVGARRPGRRWTVRDGRRHGHGRRAGNGYERTRRRRARRRRWRHGQPELEPVPRRDGDEDAGEADGR